MIRTVVASVFLLLGTAMIAISAVGLIRLPDVYNRMNAVAKAAGFGLSFVLFGVLLLVPSVRTAVVVLVAVGLQLFTAPVGGYALARAAYRAGAPLASITRYDQLGGRTEADGHRDDNGDDDGDGDDGDGDRDGDDGDRDGDDGDGGGDRHREHRGGVGG